MKNKTTKDFEFALICQSEEDDHCYQVVISSDKLRHLVNLESDFRVFETPLYGVTIINKELKPKT